MYLIANRFDRITDYGFNHKAHKDHKGLAKVNAIPDNPKTFCAGFVPFVSFVVYTRRRSV